MRPYARAPLKLEEHMTHTFKKGLLSLVLVALLVCSCMIFAACGDKDGANATPTGSDSSVVASGDAGNNVTWTVYGDGRLTLTGSPENGAMYNHSAYGTTAPWKEYADQITGVEIADGIITIADAAFSGMKKIVWVQLGSATLEIGKGAFRNCTNLRRLVLPSTVTTLEEGAFAGCFRLWEVQLNEGLTEIGAGAFSGCYSLLSVTLPSTVSASGVASDAFAGCEKLMEVITSASVSAGSSSFGGVAKYATEVHSGATKVKNEGDFVFLGDRLVGYTGTATEITLPATTPTGAALGVVAPYAFYANTTLTSVTVPDNVTTLNAKAFAGCENLATVTLGQKVKTLGEGLFEGCWSLTTLNLNAKDCSKAAAGVFADTALTTVTLGANVEAIPAGIFKNCTTLVQIAIPEKVETIGEGAFEGCTSLAQVTGGEGCEEIEKAAFKNCVKLMSFAFDALPSGAAIREQAFAGCTSLVRVDLTSIKNVGASAFANCSSITGVIIGSSTSIGNEAFRGCYKLVDVVNNNTRLTLTVGSTLNGYVAMYTPFTVGTGSFRLDSVNGFLFMTDAASQSFLVGYEGTSATLALPANYKGGTYRIADYAFYGNSGIATVNVSAGVTAIGKYAFASSMTLKTVNLAQATIDAIGECAFEECTRLQNVNLGTTVATIGESAFRGCSALQTVAIPASVSSLGEYAFANTGLETVTVGGGIDALPAYLFANAKKLANVTLASGIEEIGNGAFVGCVSLKGIALPATLTEIGDYAFYRCEGLKSIVLTNSVSTVGERAFAECVSLYSVTLGTALETVGESAFRGCDKLLEVVNNSSLVLATGEDGPGMLTARAKVVSTGTSAAGEEGDYIYIVLDGDTYLVGYTGTETILTLPSSLNDTAYKILGYAFYDSEITEVTIPTGVLSIGMGAFENSRLTKLNISSVNCSLIGSHAFANTPLTSVEMRNVQVVGSYAFYNCDLLRVVTLSDSVTTLQMGAFADCDILYTVNFGSSPSASKLRAIEAYCFDNCTSLTYLKLADATTSFGTQWVSNCPRLRQISYTNGLNKDFGSSNWNPMSKEIYINKLGDAYNYIHVEGDFVFYYDGNTPTLVGYIGSDAAVVLPDRYKGKAYNIGAYAFYNLDFITSVKLQSGESGIGAYAFADCDGLTSVYIPVKNNAAVDACVFAGCSKQLLVVTGVNSAADVPNTWSADWARYDSENAYQVYYGYTYEQYLSLIGE